MIIESDIRKLTEYVLLNAYSVDSTGFYNGKAGVSLCLFEIAKILDDSYFEEHAFELLKESLLSKNEDIGFENGLSGIGYVLRYLIKHEFIEGEFNDLFGDNMKKIKDRVARLSENERKRGDFLTVGYLLNDKVNIHLLVDPLYEDLMELLPDTLESSSMKTTIVQKYAMLFKVLSHYPDIYDTSGLSRNYVSLYTKGKVTSEYSIGYYMDLLTRRGGYPDKAILAVSADCMRYALMSSTPSTLTMSQRVDLLYLLRKDEPHHGFDIERLESGLMNLSGKELERTLLGLMTPMQLMAGYEQGISRFLLYVAFLWNKGKGEDVSRFDKLF